MSEVVKLDDHGQDMQVTMNKEVYANVMTSLESLEDMTPTIDVISRYWGSQQGARVGDSRRCIFLRKAESVDENGEPLNFVEFVWKNNGEMERFRNASAQLVAAMEGAKEGQPFLITLKDKIKGSKHSYDGWSVKPLV
jgi:hypothetical protein